VNDTPAATSQPDRSAPPALPSAGGLTSAEVAERHAAGQANVQPQRSSRTYGGIVAANVLTRFNAIITLLAAVILAVGDPIDAIFAVVMVFNTAIGIVQEVRAKRTLDRLQILITPTITAIRDGAPTTVAPGDLVRGDVIRLGAGDQVPVDGTVLESSGLEADESALTGESDAIPKAAGDEVRSGSVVVSGNAVVHADAVGADTWIHQLLTQAKQFGLATSELRRGVDTILAWVSWAIVPIAALLLWSQLRDGDDVGEGLVSAVAGVVGLVPQGLVLLVSMALAVAVLRLARDQVVIQELHAVEGLARIDVLCVDKTGTLTTGVMTLDRIEPFDLSIEQVSEAIAALAGCEETPNATLAAAAGGLASPGWNAIAHVPFNSARKWSGATFDTVGTWLLGAPEVLLAASAHARADTVRARIGELAQDARRVVLVARSASPLVPATVAGEDASLPSDVEPVALVIIAEELRPDAADTMRYFADQGVTVKIISGDNPATVSAVGGRLGIPGADDLLDMRDVDLDGPVAEVDALVTRTTVFGRVQPQQKRALVEILQRQGHTVAMTGDGVNDIPALKQADVAIAQNTATAATKAVSQLVLLDGRFDRMPGVVAEGRRVITNMERVSALFVTKTVYAAAFAIVIGIWGASFPFLPRHLSLVSETTIGIPAFALSFRSAGRPYRPGYLRRVLRFAVPAGLVSAAIVLVGYGLVRSPLADATLDEARTASTLMLLTIALWVLLVLMLPIDRFDAVVLGAMVLLAAVVIATPFGRDFYALDLPSAADTTLLTGYLAAALGVVTVALRIRQSRRSADPDDAVAPDAAPT
jgi:cation-transporting ATPase E